MSEHHSANRDVRPPVPVGEYDLAAQRVNPGYGLALELVTALLRAHSPADTEILVVGAGGGMEVQTFGAAEPGWRLTGVDPSADMLALARAKAAAGLDERARLVQGTLDDLAPAARFDAATAMFVLMHLPDDGAKLHLLRGVARRFKLGAPLLLIDSLRDHRERFLPAAVGGRVRAHPCGRHDHAGGARTGAAGRGRLPRRSALLRRLHDERLGRRAVNGRIGGRIADCPATAHSAPHSPDRPWAARAAAIHHNCGTPHMLYRFGQLSVSLGGCASTGGT